MSTSFKGNPAVSLFFPVVSLVSSSVLLTRFTLRNSLVSSSDELNLDCSTAVLTALVIVVLPIPPIDPGPVIPVKVFITSPLNPNTFLSLLTPRCIRFDTLPKLRVFNNSNSFALKSICCLVMSNMPNSSPNLTNLLLVIFLLGFKLPRCLNTSSYLPGMPGALPIGNMPWRLNLNPLSAPAILAIKFIGVYNFVLLGLNIFPGMPFTPSTLGFISCCPTCFILNNNPFGVIMNLLIRATSNAILFILVRSPPRGISAVIVGPNLCGSELSFLCMPLSMNGSLAYARLDATSLTLTILYMSSIGESFVYVSANPAVDNGP